MRSTDGRSLRWSLERHRRFGRNPGHRRCRYRRAVTRRRLTKSVDWPPPGVDVVDVQRPRLPLAPDQTANAAWRPHVVYV